VEYQFFDKNNLLLNDVSKMIGKAKSCSPQEFYNMLMICETIVKLLRKLFLKLAKSANQEITSVDIIIDMQNSKVISLFKEGFLYCFLFAVSRENPFYCIVKNFKHTVGERSYFDVTKFGIKIVSDDDQDIIFIPDYIASFTQKALTGQIISKPVIDKLSLLYGGDKAPVFLFHPVVEYKDVQVAEKSSYAYDKLLEDVFYVY
jgi:hypothetical protein